MATVNLEKVTKIYPNGKPAVQDLDLDVAEGELMVLVGPSGSGKTTALRMVAGLEDITSGTLRMGGKVVNDLAPKDRNVAMVFQSYALYPHMTVAENIGFSLKSAQGAQGRGPGQGQRRRQPCWASPTTWTASPPSCRVASARGWPWAGPSSASRRCS